MPRPLIITLKEGVDPVYGVQKALAPVTPVTVENGTLTPGNYRYVLMSEKSTYTKGVHALRTKCEKENDCRQPLFIQEDGSRIYRPLTFKENIEARVNNFNTLYDQNGKERNQHDRLRLFTRRWLYSCTGIADKKGSTKFKLVPQASELISIPNITRLSIDYDSIIGIELDRKDAVYNDLLTQSQVERHPAWLAAVDGDAHLLKAHSEIVFNVLQQQNKAMGFYVVQTSFEDQLRALLVGSLGNDSSASGNNYLSSSGSFLRVAPVGAPEGDAQKII